MPLISTIKGGGGGQSNRVQSYPIFLKVGKILRISISAHPCSYKMYKMYEQRKLFTSLYVGVYIVLPTYDTADLFCLY